MSPSSTEVRPTRRGWPPRWVTLAIACLMASGAVTIVAGTATAKAAQASAGPGATRAAIAPALTAGRGASVPFVEQEAETAVTNGTVIEPTTANIAVVQAFSPDGTSTVRAPPSRAQMASSRLREVGVPRRP